MIIVTEDTCRQVIGRDDAFTAVEAVFAAMAKGDAWNFPVCRLTRGPPSTCMILLNAGARLISR